MKRVPIVVKYAVFAAIATGINIAVQRGVAFFVEGSYSIYISLFFGTIAGLVVKYLMDKRFVFISNDGRQGRGKNEDSRSRSCSQGPRLSLRG
jgi:putative flippase GtrA